MNIRVVLVLAAVVSSTAFALDEKQPIEQKSCDEVVEEYRLECVSECDGYLETRREQCLAACNDTGQLRLRRIQCEENRRT